MKIISVQEAAEELQIPEEMVIRRFHNLIETGQVEGFYDEQDNSIIEYSQKDINTITKIVDERGRVSVDDVAKEMRLTTRIVEQILRGDLWALSSSDYTMDGNLLLKNHYILQCLREIIAKNDRALYDVASKQIGVSEETIRSIVRDFPGDFSLEGDRGVTTEERFIRDKQPKERLLALFIGLIWTGGFGLSLVALSYAFSAPMHILTRIVAVVLAIIFFLFILAIGALIGGV